MTARRQPNHGALISDHSPCQADYEVTKESGRIVCLRVADRVIRRHPRSRYEAKELLKVLTGNEASSAYLAIVKVSTSHFVVQQVA